MSASRSCTASLSAARRDAATARSPWPVLLVVSACYAFAFTDRQILNLMVGHMRADFRIDDAQAGFILGPAFSFSYTAMGLIAGYFADRRSRRNLLVGAGLVWSVSTILSGFAASYEQMIAARLTIGASEAFLFPAGMSLIADLFDRRRLPTATTLFLICPYVGGGLAMILGGLVLGIVGERATLPVGGIAIAGWQVALVTVGLLGLIPILLLTRLREPLRGGGHGVHGVSGVSASLTFFEGTRFMVERWRFFFVFFFGIAFICLMLHGIPAWSPTIFIREYGMSSHFVGVTYGLLVLLCGICGGLCSPVAERWFARRSPESTMLVVLCGPVIMATVAALLFFVSDPWVAYGCIAVMSFGYCFAMPMAGVSLQLATPPALRGQAASFYFVIINLFGLGLGPLLVPWTASALGDGGSLATALSIDTIVTAAIALLLLSYARLHFREGGAGE